MLEVLAFLATAGLAVFWARDPNGISGSYEPWIVICGVVTAAIELYRRFGPQLTSSGIELYRRFRPQLTSSQISPEAIIEEIRVANGVRALRPLESDKKLEQLPNGVFGFDVPWALDKEPNDSLSLTHLRVTQSKGGTAVVEIHKSASGEFFVIGFVSQSSQVQLEDPSRTTPIDMHVFFGPYDEFIHPVAIPFNRIIRSEHRQIEEAYLWDIRIQ